MIVQTTVAATPDRLPDTLIGKSAFAGTRATKIEFASEHLPGAPPYADVEDDLDAARGIVTGLAICGAFYLVGALTWWLV